MRVRRLPRFTTRRLRSTLLFAAMALPLGAREARAGGPTYIIDNGTIQLGVDAAGCLNVSGGTPSADQGTTTVGLRHVDSNYESLAGGAPQEGWGFADLNSSTSGGARSLIQGGFPLNLSYVNSGSSGSGTQKESVGDSAFTIAELPYTAPLAPEGAALVIRHDFRPSIDARLYEVEVTIRNLTHATLKPRYRRMMDWDVEPYGKTFNDFVTLRQGRSTAVVDSIGNGFNSVDPFDPLSGGKGGGCMADANFTDCGPGDHGATFDFEFPEMPPGGTLRFWLYYGAAPTESGAEAALQAVGASAYSLGQSAAGGTPVTFIFGFKAPWAVVDNGTIALGVDMFGSLNVHGGTLGTGGQGGGKESPARGTELPITGLRHLATNYDGTAPGSPREGWGVADLDSAIGGGTTSLIDDFLLLAPEPEGEGPVAGQNMTPLDLDVFGVGSQNYSVGRRVIVTTLIGDPAILRVIHDFRPSTSPNLYRVLVDVKNVTKAPIVIPRYRRLADFDVAPFPFNDELITTVHGSSGVVDSMGTAYVHPNPVVAWSDVGACGAGPHDECGPADIGMAFELEFDEIPALGREQFLLFYGSTANEATALTALSTVGATAYAIGEKPILFAPEVGPPPPPPVWIFGFRDVLFVDDFETSDTSRWSAEVP